MSVSLQQDLELGMVALLDMLGIYAEAETQEEPYLIKDGIKIIF